MDPRDELTAYLRRQLMGPADGEREVLHFPPDRQYLVGTLYPRDADLHGQLRLAGDMDDEDEGRGTEEAREDTDPAIDPLPSVNSWLPSSLGISFYTDATELQVNCSAARYLTEQGERARQWRREPLPEETRPVGPKDESPVEVFAGLGELTVHWRPFREGHLVTVGLANAKRAGDADRRTPAWDRMLFQVRLSVTVSGGRIRQYPSTTLISRDEEEQELRLQYRHVRTHAIGHGCAVGEVLADGRVGGLKTELLPHVDVPDVRAAGPTDLPVLRLARLSDDQVAVGDLREEFRAFAAGYRAWYEGQRTLDVPPWGRPAADRILARIEAAVRRIESGIETLCDTERPEILAAFRTVNRAMALQMRHSARDQAGERRERRTAMLIEPDPDPEAAWRPFQLAFFLLALDGTVDPGHSDRDTVDLIWFPTGGGKTEAYLLLAAFAMVLRRFQEDGGGTAVLSRYTLSLLTTQQFQRAATLVCALERLRARTSSDSAASRSPSACGSATPRCPTAMRMPSRPSMIYGTRRTRGRPSSSTAALGAAHASCRTPSPWTGATTASAPRQPPSRSTAHATSASSTRSYPSPSWTITSTTGRRLSSWAPSTSSRVWPGRPGPDGSSASVESATARRAWSSKTNFTCSPARSAH
jgi:hypothetical protein